MREPGDRTTDVKAAPGRLEMARGDVCDAFEQDADRLFSNRECWYCKYGNFGILTEHPTQNGVCTYKTTMNTIHNSFAKRHENDTSVQASKRQEEKTK
ncbi:hypothetical protein [Oscillibacter sp.]|uniref:hypothetical protein n=1 Tax=Oscillibacter sp. TaxID=1945593 RepID=UPI0028A0BA30|nr:hypothetical protein [Oscillibacter sp.]